jgi:hypothetical protein
MIRDTSFRQLAAAMIIISLAAALCWTIVDRLGWLLGLYMCVPVVAITGMIVPRTLQFIESRSNE